MADILYLVERLEQILSQGWRVPFTTNAVIDEDALIDVIEQMHIAIPTEVRQAQQLMQQKDQFLSEARDEADALVAEARREAGTLIEDATHEADRLVTETDIVAQARDRADQIVAEANREADDVRAGADSYAVDVLSRIHHELNAYLRQVDNGLARLQPPPPLEAEPESQGARIVGDEEPLLSFEGGEG